MFRKSSVLPRVVANKKNDAAGTADEPRVRPLEFGASVMKRRQRQRPCEKLTAASHGYYFFY